ncbi:putative flagellin protein [Aurantimonas manganoxydans SI85-9A1]|uniref:Flagellin n=1 Tax=Aurantimonas manganoxydans (strain ATCC BAA-1229 / DSM 21871 / SI85-9A1) TaxID=287752 RepID=Q1YKZ8_AURMS|nr:flagellin [Aurantimonas manganoxydans]EAS50375.1 putative flagellin protein [Aurantimonas manganoxydans SI85-9A1]
MTSIITNSSAMTALKTLSATNAALSATQSRISTGFRVAVAADNAAYWSIATTMRSDNNSLSAVQDALGLGMAKIDTAYTGMTAAIDLVDEIKAKLVAAREPGVDRAKVQSEITQLQEQLISTAAASSFSGENWLSVNSDDTGYNATKSIVSSFNRSSSGAVSIGTIDIDASRIALFDGSATADGLLDAGAATGPLSSIGGLVEDSGTGVPGVRFNFSSFALSAAETVNFDLALGANPARTITIDKALIDATLGSSDGTVSTSAAMKSVLDAAFTNAGYVSWGDFDNVDLGGVIDINNMPASGPVAITNLTLTATGTSGITAIDITNASSIEIEGHISSVDAMLGKMITAAADLGAARKRAENQSTFVSNLKDTIDRGVGTLVDADMNKESTRLKALQVQQQLGVQALSIANGNSQSILSLFR